MDARGLKTWWTLVTLLVGSKLAHQSLAPELGGSTIFHFCFIARELFSFPKICIKELVFQKALFITAATQKMYTIWGKATAQQNERNHDNYSLNWILNEINFFFFSNSLQGLEPYIDLY